MWCMYSNINFAYHLFLTCWYMVVYGGQQDTYPSLLADYAIAVILVACAVQYHFDIYP